MVLLLERVDVCRAGGRCRMEVVQYEGFGRWSVLIVGGDAPFIVQKSILNIYNEVDV